MARPRTVSPAPNFNPSTTSEDVIDAALVQRIANGDRGALGSLYARHQPFLFQYLLAVTPDQGTAEEILQDVLLAVWYGARTFGGRSRVTTWLMGIARRQAHTTLRRHVLAVTDLQALEERPSDGADPQDVIIGQEDRKDLADAFSRLSAVHREALLLAFQQGLSYQELTELLGIPLGTVRSRLSNAKRALKAILAQQRSECW